MTNPSDHTADAPNLANAYIPHTEVSAYCSTPETLMAVRAALAHPLMKRAQANLRQGTAADALSTLQPVKTPEILIIEDTGDDLGWLDRLAEICGAQTHLIVIGQANDIATYRRLMRRGVSDYLFSPVSANLVVKTIADIFARDTSRRQSQMIGFFGTGGGNGTSFLTNAMAQIMAEAPETNVMLVDLDLYCGTQAAMLDVDPGKSLTEALRLVQSLGPAELEKLVSEKRPNLHLLSAQVPLEQQVDVAPDALVHILDLARTISDVVLLDIPSGWGPLQRALLAYVNDAVFCSSLQVESFHRCHLMVRQAEQVRRQKTPARIVLNRVTGADSQAVSLSEFRDYLSLNEDLILGDYSQAITLAQRKGQSPVANSGRNDLRAALLPLADSLLPGRQDGVAKSARKTPAGGMIGRFRSLVGRTPVRG